jgi:hypothetical protein
MAKVYTVGERSLLPDAEKGKPIWSKEFKKDYAAKTPIWGFAAIRSLSARWLCHHRRRWGLCRGLR